MAKQNSLFLSVLLDCHISFQILAEFGANSNTLGSAECFQFFAKSTIGFIKRLRRFGSLMETNKPTLSPVRINMISV